MAKARTLSDSEVLDKLAELHLGIDSYDNPSSTIESIAMLVEKTGREIQGLDVEY